MICIGDASLVEDCVKAIVEKETKMKMNIIGISSQNFLYAR